VADHLGQGLGLTNGQQLDLAQQTLRLFDAATRKSQRLAAEPALADLLGLGWGGEEQGEEDGQAFHGVQCSLQGPRRQESNCQDLR
jgi:hypothetical protein